MRRWPGGARPPTARVEAARRRARPSVARGGNDTTGRRGGGGGREAWRRRRWRELNHRPHETMLVAVDVDLRLKGVDSGLD